MEEATERGGRFSPTSAFSTSSIRTSFFPRSILLRSSENAFRRRAPPAGGAHPGCHRVRAETYSCTRREAPSALPRCAGLIGSDDDRGVFSFNNVCMLLGMNPDYVRQGLFDWCERRRTCRAPSGVAPVRIVRRRASFPAQAADPGHAMGDGMVELMVGESIALTRPLAGS